MNDLWDELWGEINLLAVEKYKRDYNEYRIQELNNRQGNRDYSLGYSAGDLRDAVKNLPIE